MYSIFPSTRFKRDLKVLIKRGDGVEQLGVVVSILAEGKPLPEKYRDHPLRGAYEGQRECHVMPDLLLIYEISADELLLYQVRTGSHSDLF